MAVSFANVASVPSGRSAVSNTYRTGPSTVHIGALDFLDWDEVVKSFLVNNSTQRFTK